MSKELLPELKSAGFLLRPKSAYIIDLYLDIKKQFESAGIEVFISNDSASMIGVSDGVDFDEMCKKSDFLVSLGGDGTLLSLVRKSYGCGKPILGINAGNLGFLADITLKDVPDFLHMLAVGDYRIDDRMMIEGYVEQQGQRESFYAFNDVVITRPTISKMVQIDAYINQEWFNAYRGDGLIVSTPTGSTAYNLAAGGPLVYPLTGAFILTPICAHSLTQRPLVMPEDFTIRLKSHKDKVVVMVDGQDAYELDIDETLAIKGASIGAKLIHKKNHDYFSILREKLSWGDKS